MPVTKRATRISLYSLGALLLAIGAVVDAKPLVLGWTLPRAAVGLIVGGFACLWIASEM